jgi:hypothetical protein
MLEGEKATSSWLIAGLEIMQRHTLFNLREPVLRVFVQNDFPDFEQRVFVFGPHFRDVILDCGLILGGNAQKQDLRHRI